MSRSRENFRKRVACAVSGLLATSAGAQPLGAPFPAVLELSSLDGEIGFRLDGVATLDRSGGSVAPVGDVNSDGVVDLVIGAHFADPGGRSDAGSSYVVFGRDTSGASPFPAALSLADLDGSNGFRLDGVAAGDLSGYSVASAGDVNGDGVGDLVIGAWRAGPGGRSDAGSSYVVFGRDTASGGSPFPAVLSLADLDGSNGFRVDGVAPGDFSGTSVASAGDANGDGVGDLIIGASDADPGGRSDAGSSYVVFGRDTASGGSPFPAVLSLADLDGSNGFRVDGVAPGDLSGYSGASAGDVNGDGVGDLIIGAWADPGGLSDAGSSYVVFGRDTSGGSPFPASLSLAALDGSNGFRLDGVAPGDFSGTSVASAGDANGDGVGDLIIGAPWADPRARIRAGSSYVVFGRDTASGGSPFPASLSLAELDGSNGFRLDGVAPGDSSGTSVASAGDVNGDGVGDLIVGAWAADPGGRVVAGSSYVVFGRDTSGGSPFPAVLSLADLDGSNGFRVDGVAAGDRSGSSVASAGDANGDGVGDLIIGAWAADPGGRVVAGSSYVVYGRNLSPTCDQWRPVGAGVDQRVRSLTTYNDELVASGSFRKVGGLTANRIARWDGSLWRTLGEGANADIESLTTYNGDLVAGGRFSKAGGADASHIARWDGSSWKPLGAGTDGWVRSLTTYDGELIAGGGFAMAGGEDASRIARWDGSSWRALGAGMNDWVESVTTYNGDLIVGGSFTTAGGRNVNHIARWDGSSWHELGDGTDGPIFSLTTYRGELIAGGDFTTAGGQDANRIARWDGSSWRPLGAGMNDPVRALTIYNNELVAGGSFTSAGGQSADRIARWDGSGWHTLSTSLNAVVRSLMSFNGELIAGGDFTGAGGHSANHLAAWLGCPECYADCDGSGSLDFFDFLCFQNLFAAGDPEADCDASGALDFFDFLSFQNAFAAGCP